MHTAKVSAVNSSTEKPPHQCGGIRFYAYILKDNPLVLIGLEIRYAGKMSSKKIQGGDLRGKEINLSRMFFLFWINSFPYPFCIVNFRQIKFSINGAL